MSLRLIANWKLNGSRLLNEEWLKEFNKDYQGSKTSSLGIAPPSIFINEMVRHPDNQAIAIGSQNIDHLTSGARTGEISSPMVKDSGGIFSIVGHSERRIFFNETNAEIAKKLDLASESSLMPILCIGESETDKQQNKTKNILEQQIIHALTNTTKLDNLIIAYEPVWAIGTGNTPEPKEINSIHETIKDIVQSLFPKLDLNAVLYGGSVNMENATSIFKEKEVDGALVGGSSLKGGDFANLANTLNYIKGL